MDRTTSSDLKSSATSALESDVHRALVQLYDPDKLGKSPLLAVFGLRHQPDPATVLRRLLLDAIEALKPEDTAPLQANVWRIYHILRHRYVEQIPQQEIAASLALSQRQLRRYEQVALHVLTDHLVSYHGVQISAVAPDAAAHTMAGETTGESADTASQELDWLRTSVSIEAARLVDVLEPVLETLRPVLRASRVHVETIVPDTLPLLAVHLVTMRQALVSILTVASRCVPRGRISIRASARGTQVAVLFEARPGTVAPPPFSRDDVESLEMARQLVAPSGGRLELNEEARPEMLFSITVIVPVAQRLSVLVIDDNADAHQLLRRYLEGSPYTFVGVSDPREALAKATAVAPRAILLDVMLPGIDGWELLGRLREHPVTRNTPIIVCTILPHERLSLTLGAAAFLRKPFTRAALLAVLDAQAGRIAPLRGVR